MCGIVGLTGYREDCAPLAWQMTRAIEHRGPDAAGVADIGVGFLGHRRLSIIDVSDAAAQPMWDCSRRHCLVFNGEIYNYLELKDELADLGVTFASSSDTEVLLEGYKTWGLSVLDRLNGMFAFALWDDSIRTLILARDRFGKKPLYYTVPGRNRNFSFASELKALRLLPDFDSTISPSALGSYFAFGHTGCRESILAGAKKLPPGSAIRVSFGRDGRVDGVIGPVEYWRLDDALVGPPRSAEYLEALLRDATTIRLRSDVPVGVFLSGGIDSSVITMLATEGFKGAGSLHTFTMGVPRSTLDESSYARDVARRFGTTHHEEDASALNPGDLDMLVEQFDEPFSDESALPLMKMSRLARAAGIKVDSNR